MLNIKKKLETLPVLPDKVNQLLNLKYEMNYDTKKLLELIEQDPTLTTRLLELANSKYFGFLNPIYTPGRALSLYGMNFTIAICVVELILNSLKFDLKAYGVSYLEFKRISDSSFRLLFDWIDESEADLRESLIIPLFLQHIGKFLISDFIVKEEKTTNFKSLLLDMNMDKVEKDFTGISSSSLSALILKKWGFPSYIVEMIFSLDISQTLSKNKKEVSVLKVINSLVDLKDPFSKLNTHIALNNAKEFSLDAKKLEKCLKKFQKEYNK